MASLVLGTIGAAIGAPFGLAAVGWAVGSALGSVLFPPDMPDQIGPRLSDLKVQNSAYGAFIPIIYGTFRLAGNVIWATDLIEHRHEEEVGGKGGGGQTQVTFTYTSSFAVSLCEGPIAAVRRIWADSKLIYDKSTGSETSSFTASSFKLYLGDEAQLPDPTIEATMGVGNVPAYRGQAYWVFSDLELANFGNRVPNLTFEVVTSGTTSSTPVVSSYTVLYGADGVIYNPLLDEIWMLNYDSPDAIARLLPADGSLLGFVTSPAYLSISMVYDPVDQMVWTSASGGYRGFDATDGTYVRFITGGSYSYVMNVSPFNGVLWDASGSASYGATNGYLRKYDKVLNTYVAYLVSIAPIRIEFSNDGNVWMLANGASSRIKLRRFNTASNTVDYEVAPATTYGIGEFIYDKDRNSLWLCTGNTSAGEIVEFDLDSLTITRTVSLPNSSLIQSWLMAYDTARGVVWVGNNATGYATGINTSDGSIYQSVYVGTYAMGHFAIEGGNVWVVDQGTEMIYKIAMSDALTVAPVALSDIVEDLSIRVGLSSGQVDVAPLVDMVDGYGITNQMNGRGAVEPLSRAYMFDSVESDSKVKFVKRGVGSAVTIDSNNLMKMP